jgi:maleate isomerase
MEPSMIASRAVATITPSGNRVVEAVTQAMAKDIPGIAMLYSRIPVVGDTGGANDYAWDRMMEAAELLSHAKPDVISWNGTKGGSLGFDIDRTLTGRIEAATGVPASTSALAILDALRALGARSIALVTPYDAAYQTKCVAAFGKQGFACASERHSGLTDNLSYASVGADAIAGMTRAAVAEARPDAVVYFCTNFAGAFPAGALEDELDVPILDSTAMGVWGALRRMGADLAPLKRWGRVFDGRFNA